MHDCEKLSQFLSEDRLEKLESVLASRSDSLTVLLDEVGNEKNISSVIRCADAFGLLEIHVIRKSLSLSPGICLGTQRWVKVCRHDSQLSALEELQAKAYKIVPLCPPSSEQSGCGPSISSLPIYELPFDERLALVFGNERRGISEEISERADYFAHIPMYGFIDSLNIAVACAISLFCSTVSCRGPARPLKPLTPDRREELRELWLGHLVKNADIILRDSQRNEESRER